MNKFLTIALASSILSACSVGPDYEKPEMGLSDVWSAIPVQKPEGATTENALKVQTAPEKVELAKDEKPADDVFTKDAWWENFGDATLNDLIKQAEAENKDLKIAQARVKEARANRLSTGALFLPQVNAAVDTSRSNQRSAFNAKPVNAFQAGFDAGWEIDIFGGQRRRFEAADYLVEASKADKQNVLISLRSEVARNYVEVRNYQNQIRITEDNIKSQEESFKLTKAQRDAGVVSDLDVSQAESLFHSTTARLPTLQTSLEAAKNNLGILLAKQPGQLDEVLAKPVKVPVADKKFIIDTPANVIAKRPDVEFAERNLAAATALQGAAIAQLFPSLSLTSFFGYQNTSLIQGGNLWSLGASALLPVVDFGRIRGEIRAADARQEQNLNNYERTVLEALAEVQTNLTAYINEEQRRASLAKAAESSEKAVTLSKQRYDTGVAAFTDVLIAQREMYDVQSQLAESEALVARNLIALNKSLGR